MALLPAKTSSNAKSHSSNARFRQRKISVKQPLVIYKQRDLSETNDLEPSQINHLNNSNQPTQQRDLHTFETGVDKNEEDEIHLQQVINAATKALLNSKKIDQEKDNDQNSLYIPTPDASGIWPEASKYYNDQKFIQPESYIKFSATIEDTVSVEYNMDEQDDQFLISMNKKFLNNPCSEIEFEMIVDKFEKIIEQKQPFLSIDPLNILSFKEISQIILQEFNENEKQSNNFNPNYSYLSTFTLKQKLSQELNWNPFVTIFDKSDYNNIKSIPELLSLFGEKVYNHWKPRKIARQGKLIQPCLKFEDPNANEKDNDADPYICFRRREFRQARKTRRADTLSAERIRLLQKSLQSARDIILNVAQREILKLKNFECDEQIFKLRVEAKSLKRSVGIKGDDHLFYPHKRKKVIKVKDDDDFNNKKEKRASSREQSSVAISGTNNTNVNKQSSTQQQQQSLVQNQQEASSSSQPYVKLPPSKIPDMDLVTVSLVLKEKDETIKRAVMEKLRKRKEQDKGYINLTDDPYQPYFNITTNNENYKEISHIPYSSIAATNYHQINTTNYLNESVKKILEDGKKALPGVKTLRGSNGELIPSKAFPHLSSLLQHGKDKYKNQDSVGYIAQLLSNIESSNYNTYNNGYGQIQTDEIEEYPLSDPIFRLRKRLGRNNRIFVDRRSLLQRPNELINEFLNFNDDDDDDDNDNNKFNDNYSSNNNYEIAADANNNNNYNNDNNDDLKVASMTIPNVYDSRIDAITRLDSRWKFDNDLSETQKGVLDPFGLDPSKLNSISDDTQSIRFGSMLLSKSYGLLRDAVHQKQQLYLQQVRLRTLQQSSRQSQNSQLQNNTSQSPQTSMRTGLNGQRQISHQPLSKSPNQLPNSNYNLNNPGHGLANTSPQLNSQQPNATRQPNTSTTQLYNNNNNNDSRTGSNYTDSKLTNNFNAHNIKHYNKTSPIASTNKLSTPVSATQK